MAKTYRLKEVSLHGDPYWITDGGEIVPVGWNGEAAYAGLIDGLIWRKGECIGQAAELAYGGTVEVAVTAELLVNMVCATAEMLDMALGEYTGDAE